MIERLACGNIWTWDWVFKVHLVVECWSSIYKVPRHSPAPQKPSIVIPACNSSNLEADEGSEVQGHLVIHRKFKVDLRDLKPCFKKKVCLKKRGKHVS